MEVTEYAGYDEEGFRWEVRVEYKDNEVIEIEIVAKKSDEYNGRLWIHGKWLVKYDGQDVCVKALDTEGFDHATICYWQPQGEWWLSRTFLEDAIQEKGAAAIARYILEWFKGITMAMLEPSERPID